MALTALVNTATVKGYCRRLAAAGCEVRADYPAGTVRVLEQGTVVYSALQKGKGGDWIVRCVSHGRITWE